MKRKANEVEAQEGEEIERKSEQEETAKRVKEDLHSTYALHESIIRELRRLGVQTDPLPASTAASASVDASAGTSSSSSSSSLSTSTGGAGKPSLPAAFLELNSFTYPSELFESERWDLKDVELRNWWAPSSRGGARPCVELGSAKVRSSDAYVYIALPTDTADPAQPVMFVKHTDGRDGPVGTDEEGVPLAEFLASLQIPRDEEEEEEEEDDEEDGDNDPYSGFISAIVAGEELPSEDEEDEDHDADQDDDEDYDEEGDEGDD